MPIQSHSPDYSALAARRPLQVAGAGGVMADRGVDPYRAVDSFTPLLIASMNQRAEQARMAQDAEQAALTREHLTDLENLRAANMKALQLAMQNAQTEGTLAINRDLFRMEQQAISRRRADAAYDAEYSNALGVLDQTEDTMSGHVDAVSTTGLVFSSMMAGWEAQGRTQADVVDAISGMVRQLEERQSTVDDAKSMAASVAAAEFTRSQTYAANMNRSATSLGISDSMTKRLSEPVGRTTGSSLALRDLLAAGTPDAMRDLIYETNAGRKGYTPDQLDVGFRALKIISQDADLKKTPPSWYGSVGTALTLYPALGGNQSDLNRQTMLATLRSAIKVDENGNQLLNPTVLRGAWESTWRRAYPTRDAAEVALREAGISGTGVHSFMQSVYPQATPEEVVGPRTAPSPLVAAGDELGRTAEDFQLKLAQTRADLFAANTLRAQMKLAGREAEADELSREAFKSGTSAALRAQQEFLTKERDLARRMPTGTLSPGGNIPRVPGGINPQQREAIMGLSRPGGSTGGTPPQSPGVSTVPTAQGKAEKPPQTSVTVKGPGADSIIGLSSRQPYSM